MTEPAEAAHTAAKHAGNAFTKKVGPFPLWAWGLIVGGIVLGYRVMNSRGPTTAEAAADPDTTDAQPSDINTLTGSGPAGVGGFFVPIDSFGKGVNIPATPPPAPVAPKTYPKFAAWLAYRRAHPRPPIRHVTTERTNAQELARKWLGSPIYWRLIHNQNLGIVAHPGDIPAGTTVLIPQPTTATP